MRKTSFSLSAVMFIFLSDRSFDESFVIIVGSSTSLLGLLGLGSAQLAGLEDGSGSELNVLFRAHSYQVTWDVNELFSNSNMSLSDENSSVMDGVSELSLGDEGLESSLHDL